MVGLLGFFWSSAGPVLVLSQARDDWRGSGGRRWGQAIEHCGAGLNGRASVVEVERTQAAKFLAAAGAAWAAMQRLRHHIAVAGLDGGYVGADDVHPAVAVGQLQRRAGQRGFGACVTATNHNHIELLGVKHLPPL
jgi:hypothetical protein